MDFKHEMVIVEASRLIVIDVDQTLHEGIDLADYKAGHANFTRMTESNYAKVNTLGRALSILAGVTSVSISRYTVRIKFANERLFDSKAIGAAALKNITAYFSGQ